ncbi:MAG: glycosyltransferase family 39 protein [Cyanobacteria bacterium J06598_3]
MKQTVSSAPKVSANRDPINKDILILLGWTALLLACTFLHPSLLAHDEGTYAAESRFMLNQGNWLAREWWGTPTYSHGIFLNWLIMIGYTLLGQRDWVARLPSVIACLASVVLTYEIAKTLIASQPWPAPSPTLGQKNVGLKTVQHDIVQRPARAGKSLRQEARQLALLSGLLLMVFSLWAQFGHLVSQNMLLVAVELLGIWALLRAERFDKNRAGWGFLTGITFGIGFLIKTFMIVLPAIALLPYLIFQHRRHRHLSNPGLWAGLITGLGLMALWLGLGIAEYGDLVLNSMFGKLNDLGSESFNPDGSPYYYLWNIPVNMMPWGLFAVVGSGIVLRSPIFWRSLLPAGMGIIILRPRFAFIDRFFAKSAGQRLWPHAWLMLYPFLLAGLLTLFPTKTAYYPLQLHPFMAMFSAIALHHIATQPVRWPRRLISVSFALLGLILVGIALFALAAPVFFSPSSPLLAEGTILSEIRTYAALGLTLGAGWLLLPLSITQPQKWIATLLLPAWLALGTAGLNGLYGDYSPNLKSALLTTPIQPIVSAHTVDFVIGNTWNPEVDKTFTLLTFYTPNVGQLNRPIQEIPTGSILWLSPLANPAYFANRTYSVLGKLRDWQLIQLTA